MKYRLSIGVQKLRTGNWKGQFDEVVVLAPQLIANVDGEITEEWDIDDYTLKIRYIIFTSDRAVKDVFGLAAQIMSKTSDDVNASVGIVYD